MCVQPLPPLPLRTRWACGFAALSTTAVLSAALLAAWHHQADPMWLVATPPVLAELKDCEAEQARFERGRCQQAIVANRLPAELRAFPVASR